MWLVTYDSQSQCFPSSHCFTRGLDYSDLIEKVSTLWISERFGEVCGEFDCIRL